MSKPKKVSPDMIKRSNKKIRVYIHGIIDLDPGDDFCPEISSILDTIRGIGEAEIVDLEIIDPDEDSR